METAALMRYMTRYLTEVRGGVYRIRAITDGGVYTKSPRPCGVKELYLKDLSVCIAYYKQLPLNGNEINPM